MALLAPGKTFGEVATGPGAGVTLSRHAGGDILPAHEHASAYACVVLHGAFRELGPGIDADRQAGEIVVHPGGARHADSFGPGGALCLNLHLDGVWTESSTRRGDAALTVAIRGLAAEVAKGAAGDRLEAEALYAEIVSRLSGAPRPVQDDDCVTRVLQALDEDHARDWSLCDLAMIAGRHPTHLARVFRRRTGLTLGSYRRGWRLTHLCLDLRLGAAPMADLALAHGYADQAHMTRDFRNFAGLSPAAWRRRAR
jgi:AraC family transcriptional regulator